MKFKTIKQLEREIKQFKEKTKRARFLSELPNLSKKQEIERKKLGEWWSKNHMIVIKAKLQTLKEVLKLIDKCFTEHFRKPKTADREFDNIVKFREKLKQKIQGEEYEN